MDPTRPPVALIGDGPIGRAAAAHLLERGNPFVVFEVGDDVATSVTTETAVAADHATVIDVSTACCR